MAPSFVAHIIAWMQCVLFVVMEIMYASRFLRLHDDIIVILISVEMNGVVVVASQGNVLYFTGKNCGLHLKAIVPHTSLQAQQHMLTSGNSYTKMRR